MSATSLSLLEGAVRGHLIRLAIPASLGMVFNTLYNLADFWFAGQLSSEALAGVSIAGSVFFLLLAVGIGMQAGSSAVIAPYVGRGDWSAARHWVDQVFGLAVVLSLVVWGLGAATATPLVRLLGAEGEVEPLALEYVSVTLAGACTFILSFAAAGALMALGDTRSNRNALVAGFFVNLLLNPLLMFQLEMGVTGLALATVLIKAGSAVYLYRALARQLQYRPRPRFRLRQWADMLRQVVPASFNMLTVILGGFITVSLVGRFGSEHVAGYAVGLRLEQVLLLPALGLNAAMMALVGQNFGASRLQRVRETYHEGLRIGLAMAVVSVPVMVFLSPALMGLFTDEAAIRATGASYLRIDALAFYAYVVLFQCTAVLQAIKQPVFPMVLGIARQLVVPASINYVLIVWWGWPMVSIFYTIITVVIVSAVIAHVYTLQQLARVAAGGQACPA